MSPSISPNAIIAIDTAATERSILQNQITAFSHRNFGLRVMRLQRLPNTDTLVSANPKYLPVD
jgi:phage repressor protein C with HTH and peptisase S24 domain